MKKTYGIFLVVLAVSLIFLSGLDFDGMVGLGAQVAYAEEGWKKEFNDICSRTQDAMSYDRDELTNIVERCDKLKPLIEKLGDTQRRLYLKRLQMCRDLFVYALELKTEK
ncbi:MAG: hypothetical protein P8013_14645 [Candidatus Sulfobium sp.]|jgi:hypothetical protein